MNNLNAGLYVRVSTEHQVQEGYSIDAQKNNLTKFANEQGFKIYDIYSDEGISGKNIEDRPQVKRLINDIHKKKIDVVVLYKFDRLTRNMSDTEDIIKIIQECGVQIFTLSSGIVDVTSANGRFMVRLNGAVAQLEREQTIERIKVAFEQKVRNGYSLASSKISYGYMRNKGQKIQTINEKEAAIVKEIFNMYLRNKSLNDIAKELNMRNISTKLSGTLNKEGMPIKTLWQSKTIKLILSNPTYIGKVRYGINTSKYFISSGLHQPIIDIDIWNKVQRKMHNSKSNLRYNCDKSSVYYKDILFCGLCNKALTTNRTKGPIKKDNIRDSFDGYRCINREKGKCLAIGMSHKKVEKAFLNYLDKIKEFEVLDEFKSQNNNNNNLTEINKMNKKIGSLNNKKIQTMDMYVNNIISNIELDYILKKIDKDIICAKEKIKSLRDEYKSNLDYIIINKKIRCHWEYLTNSEKLLFLNQFVKEIKIINNGSCVEISNVLFYDND